mmetsp:Transcript_19212/g.16487  ORF Transcript_19212/g.16487 Transcript_19212/m.16487 type:complete len:127 (+) Transcript_19212:74-454(+)
MISGHDSNIVVLTAAMGFNLEDCVMGNFHAYWENGTIPRPECHFPWFASSAIFEVFMDTAAPFVKFKYNNDYVGICDGKVECPIVDFLTMMRDAINGNTYEGYLKECGADEFGKINAEIEQAINMF